MVNLLALKQIANLGSGSKVDSVPWGEAHFLKDKQLKELPRSHIRRHLDARNEPSNGNRTTLCLRLQSSLDNERKEGKRIMEEIEKKIQEVARKEEEGAIYCVGSNEKGQARILGEDSGIFRVIDETRGFNIVNLETRNDLIFAVSEDHKVFCWGAANGPTAIPDNFASKLINAPQLVEKLEEEDIVGTAISSDAALALNKSGNVYSWGCGQCGCLGNGMMKVQEDPALIMSLVNKYKVGAISAGAMHFAALATDGTLFGWGLAASGRLGRNPARFPSHMNQSEEIKQRSLISHFPEIIKIPFMREKITMISCGAEHTIASSKCQVFSWGSNDGGRLGLGDNNDRHTPCEIESLRGLQVLDISAGTWHSACIAAFPPMMRGGWVWTWGSGYQGQLGQCVKSISTKPALVPFFPDNQITARSIVCGSHHNACITSEMELFTWGSNENGCLGRNLEVGCQKSQIEFSATPGYCEGFGAIVDRIGRGFVKSIAVGKGFTIVATEKYAGPTEKEASTLMKSHQLKLEAEKTAIEKEASEAKRNQKIRDDKNDRRNNVLHLTSRRGCTICDCKGFQVKASASSICRECGHSSIYHTIQ